MSGEFLDLRVKRTRKAIRNALFELLEEKEFNKISIHAIAQKAEISRVTFYSHYKDMNDLIDAIITDLLVDIKKIIRDKFDESYKQGNEEASLISLLEYIAANAYIYKRILVSKQIPFFTPRLMDYIYQLILTTTEKQPNKEAANFSTMNTSSDIAAWYGTSAMIGTIAMWLGNDMPYSPKELAQQLIQLNPFKPAINRS